MSKPTYESLWAINEGLFELMEWDTELRTWQMRVIRDVREIIRDKMRNLKKDPEATDNE